MFHCYSFKETKNEDLMKIRLSSGHSICRGVCFFIKTYMEKLSITSLAHQESLQWMGAVRTRVKSHYINWWAWVTWKICGRLINCFDSHSDGTHSLQGIDWWANCVMFLQICSYEETNASTYWMAWLNLIKCHNFFIQFSNVHGYCIAILIAKHFNMYLSIPGYIST